MSYTTTLFLIIIIVIAFYFFSFKIQGRSEFGITTEQAQDMMTEKDSLVLLDVRTHKEYVGEEGHLPGSILIPLHELKSRVDELEKFRNNELIVICSSGSRSGVATRFLRKEGFEAFNMEGGMQAWNKFSAMPVIDSTSERNEKTIE